VSAKTPKLALDPERSEGEGTKIRNPQSAIRIPPGGGAAETPCPTFDVASADKWALDWDEKTRLLLLDRIRNVPPYRFFSTQQAILLEAICARAMPQKDRPPEMRVPIAPWIDERLHQGEGSGYRYEDMPDDHQAYRLGLTGFDETARALFGREFTYLAPTQQDKVLEAIDGGEPPGETWTELPAKRFFGMLMGDIITNYYAHPAAWAEIGFNGPASPRGHMRLSLGKRDPWEAEEVQPFSSTSIVKRALARKESEGGGESSQEATH
jgi:hypothetical protein